MTRQEFLDKLSQIGGDRWIIHHGGIRFVSTASRKHYCPITAVCKALTGRGWNTNEWVYAADDLNLGNEFAHEVVSAADASTPHDPNLRKKIREAVGVNE